MADTRPTVWVSQPLIDAAIAPLRDRVQLRGTDTVTAWSPDQIAGQLARADGAIILNERIGAARGRRRAVAGDRQCRRRLQQPGCRRAQRPASGRRRMSDREPPPISAALLMATARRITESERWLRDGQWQQWSFQTMLGADIHGSTLGILGMGHIGQGIARRGAHGFGMKVRTTIVRSCRRRPKRKWARPMWTWTRCWHSPTTCCWCCPTPASHHLIDAAALAKMKPSATLVNIARGGLVDEIALADARPTDARLPLAWTCTRASRRCARNCCAAQRGADPHIGVPRWPRARRWYSWPWIICLPGSAWTAAPSRMPSAINADAAMAARVTLGKTER